MHFRTTFATGLLIVLGAAAIATTALSGRNGQDTKQPKSEIDVVVKQLERESDIPVELLCSKVRIIPPSSLDKVSCVLKNNTNKSILAASIAYSITFESGGKESSDTRLHTIDTFVHPDFYDARKSIQSGEQRIIENPGPSFYADSVIKGVETWIEYVEFSDKTMLGDTEKGSRIITNLREGAAKYKNWLTHKYENAGKSATSTAAFLRRDLPLASELQLNDKYQEQGAKAYRTRLGRLYENLGASQIDKYLNQ